MEKTEKKTDLIHIITSLDGGGAESMLFKLLQNSDTERFNITVVSMLDGGVYGDRIKKELNIPVYELNIHSVLSGVKGLFKLLKIAKKTSIIQSWMYHANLISFIVAKMRKIKIVWGIHHNDLSLEKNKKSTIILAKFNAYLSKWVDNVIYCGHLVKKNHLSVGYDQKNGIVIPNGFDTKIFSSEKKIDIKKELDLKLDKKVFIHVGRWDPLKDYSNLIESLNMLKRLRNDFVVLLVGKNIDSENIELVNLIKKFEMNEYIYLLGRRENIPQLMASSDFFISSSSNEGFPNVIGEAMACETYCIVTDAGDSRYIVGETGQTVKVSNSTEMAEALLKSLELSAQNLEIASKTARKRIINNFSIENSVALYEEVYNSNINLN